MHDPENATADTVLWRKVVPIWWSYTWRYCVLTWSVEGILEMVIGKDFFHGQDMTVNSVRLAVTLLCSFVTFVLVMRKQPFFLRSKVDAKAGEIK